jgi:hypothetical protein
VLPIFVLPNESDVVQHRLRHVASTAENGTHVSALTHRVVAVAELILQAVDDHVARLAHESDPVRAVIELIWNAVDAEATEVVTEVEYGERDRRYPKGDGV